MCFFKVKIQVCLCFRLRFYVIIDWISLWWPLHTRVSHSCIQCRDSSPESPGRIEINWTLTLATFSDLHDEGLWRHWTSWIHCCLISRRFLTQLFNPSGALERGQDNKVQDYYYLNWQELQRSIRQLTESFESFSVKTLISFLSSLSFI